MEEKESPSPQNLHKGTKWSVFCTTFERMYIMCSNDNGVVNYAPLYIHSFRLIAPRKLLEAQLFNQQYHSYEEIQNVPDRLRWCRHHLGLMQKEVAEMIGVTRGMYIDLEVGAVDYYAGEIVDKLAALYKIPVDDLLDDYNRFIYNGQGKTITEYRLSLGLGKRPMARLLHLDPNTLNNWENERKRISKNSWKQYFKNKIK